MTVLVYKNIREILRTWRVWVLVFVLATASIAGPLLAKYSDELLSSLGGAAMAGILPEATAATAGQQWVSDLGQSVTIALALIAGTVMAGELADESYFFTLTRGVTRQAFVLAKLFALHIVLFVALVVFSLINGVITYALFNEANFIGVIQASALWFVFASFIMCGVAVLAVATSSAVGAGATGIGLMVVMGLLGTWDTAAKFSPAGINQLAAQAAIGQSLDSWLSLVCTAPIIVVLGLATVRIFSAREL